ncbi:MAG: adenylate/guanylate cyclase domain-containing protein [Bacteroidota bacterium]|nr:adenylate/guanylate cyclase domain-containing protein [Bacteroidota bacterium]
MKKVLLITLLLLVQTITVFAWDYTSKNYSGKDFNAHPLIWSFIQDAQGRIWFANNEGVLRFDGNNWSLYPIPRPVRSMAFDKTGNLFLACEGDLGVLLFDESGKFEYHSFKEQLSKAKQTGSGDNKVIEVAGDIFFTSGKYLYTVTINAKEFGLKINTLNEISGAFAWNRKLYINELYKGLGVWNGSRLNPVKDGEKLKGKTLIGEALYADGLLLGSNYHGIFQLKKEGINAINGALNNFALKGLASIATSPNGRQIALGTFSDGIKVFEGLNGREQNIKLPSNEIYSLFLDHEKNLWVAHRKGLTHVNINIPILEFNEFNLSGYVTDMQILGGNLYIASTNGLYKTDAENPSTPILVSGMNSECWDLLLLKNKLLIASTNGLFEVSSQSTKCLVPNETFVHIQKSNTDKNLIYAFSTTFCQLLRTDAQSNDAIINVMGKLSGHYEMANSIAEQAGSNPWLGTYHFGLINTDAKQKAPAELSEGEVIIRNYNSGFIFQTEKGVYVLKGDQFEINEPAGRIFSDAKNMDFDFNNDFWIYTSKVLRQIKAGKIAEQSVPYAINGRPTAICIYGKKIWFAFEDKIYLYDGSEVETPKYETFINRVVNSNGELIFDAKNKDQNYCPKIPHAENNLQVAFGINSFINPDKNLYRYKIKELGENWSTWKNESKLNLTGLAAGSYLLEVESKNATGIPAVKAELKLIILSPWYQSIYAYLLYIVCSLLFIYLIIKINSRVLITKNQKLEKVVAERTKELAQNNIELKTEKKKSDDLLLNILPGEVAEELKRKGKSEARQYEHVTVMFTDFVNFTGIGEKLKPTELVAEIDLCFKGFDAIMDVHGLEKIKTIGDAYLAVCGLPHENPEHAIQCILAARDIIEFMKNRKQLGGLFDIRVGLNSGPVVAGIVGSKKFAYDIWGDTVNVASRMESTSEANKINITGTTHELVKHKFTCQYRGKIDAKNKGMIDMYFV